MEEDACLACNLYPQCEPAVAVSELVDDGNYNENVKVENNITAWGALTLEDLSLTEETPAETTGESG